MPSGLCCILSIGVWADLMTVESLCVQSCTVLMIACFASTSKRKFTPPNESLPCLLGCRPRLRLLCSQGPQVRVFSRVLSMVRNEASVSHCRRLPPVLLMSSLIDLTVPWCALATLCRCVSLLGLSLI